MLLCSRCGKRVAVIFATTTENGESKSRGYCIKCAKEMGMPVDNMLGGVLGKFGLDSEQMEEMEENMNQMLESGDFDMEAIDGGAPAIDFNKLMGNAEGNVSGNIPKKQKGDHRKDKKKKFLDTYCRNLTQRAIEGKLDKIVGREKELQRVIQILCRRQKNNPCLIGEPGVGKTAIAEALAAKIAANDVPYKLKGHQVYLVDLTALVAGTQFRGQFEQRMQGLINEVRNEGNVILVIDEVHNIVGSGDAEGSMNAANILKPALSRGEIQVIGATTLREYRKYIEKDAALERRFQPVTVNEPSIEESVEMLKGIKHYYEDFHMIKVPDTVLEKAVRMSERYITDRYLPDKAIDLLDEASANLSLSSAEINESYEIRDKLLEIKEAREKCEGENAPDSSAEAKKYELIANYKAEEIRLSERLREIEPSCQNVVMTAEDLASVVEIWTGIPASSISENEFEKIDKLEERLKKRIIGQDKAVEAVTRAIKRTRAGISYKKKPVSFIFAGPTGVGKTELVKTLASDLFNSPETLIRLDMSEFMEKHSVARIIGAPPGYVGYDEAGQLTEKIRRKPYSVILFDEIEKAHPDVLNVLLQILDDGRITDAHGKTVNFENTVIVMTTNAGSDRGTSFAGFSAENSEMAEAKTEKALSSFLRPEFINRVDEIITFRSLDKKDFCKIAEIMIEELGRVLAEKDITLNCITEALEYIAEKSFSSKFGARNMRRFIQTNIEDKLAELIIADYKQTYTQAYIGVSEGKLSIACM
ncbi:MAG: ATP-dependent Clp protease ATP-binding subunit [Clostridia bacterium]|nr:ATP-dependent Clp protease ATP-binding subunit [Clostridia bacterium]